MSDDSSDNPILLDYAPRKAPARFGRLFVASSVTSVLAMASMMLSGAM
jgi:hypothetical protein